MKVAINNEQTNNKLLEYEENAWSGKRTIMYDGIVLTKIKRNIYEYKKDDITEQFVVKGNQLIGITINMFGQTVEIARKLTWYEIVMAILVFAPCILFGAIGGAIGGALGFTNVVTIRQIDKWYLKVIVSVQFLVIALLLSYIVACMIFKIIL